MLGPKNVDGGYAASISSNPLPEADIDQALHRTCAYSTGQTKCTCYPTRTQSFYRVRWISSQLKQFPTQSFFTRTFYTGYFKGCAQIWFIPCFRTRNAPLVLSSFPVCSITRQANNPEFYIRAILTVLVFEGRESSLYNQKTGDLWAQQGRFRICKPRDLQLPATELPSHNSPIHKRKPRVFGRSPKQWQRRTFRRTNPLTSPYVT